MSFPTALFDLSGKVALVTGGGRGLGWEMVHAFAACGADVIIASRKPDACEAAASRVQALGRLGQPPEIVTAALYLASPALSFTTGSLIAVDGGS